MEKLFNKLFPDEEMKEYRKMHRRHRKELVKLAKETSEWDWSWLHRMVIMQVRHMYEYYSAGNNVWQADESRLEVVRQLQHVLDLEKELKRTEDDDCGLELIYDGDTLVGRNKPEDYVDRIIAKENRITGLYEEIYSYIGKNIQYWWD